MQDILPFVDISNKKKKQDFSIIEDLKKLTDKKREEYRNFEHIFERYLALAVELKLNQCNKYGTAIYYTRKEYSSFLYGWTTSSRFLFSGISLFGSSFTGSFLGFDFNAFQKTSNDLGDNPLLDKHYPNIDEIVDSFAKNLTGFIFKNNLNLFDFFIEQGYYDKELKRMVYTKYDIKENRDLISKLKSSISYLLTRSNIKFVLYKAMLDLSLGTCCLQFMKDVKVQTAIKSKSHFDNLAHYYNIEHVPIQELFLIEFKDTSNIPEIVFRNFAVSFVYIQKLIYSFRFEKDFSIDLELYEKLEKTNYSRTDIKDTINTNKTDFIHDLAFDNGLFTVTLGHELKEYYRKDKDGSIISSKEYSVFFCVENKLLFKCNTLYPIFIVGRWSVPSNGLYGLGLAVQSIETIKAIHLLSEAHNIGVIRASNPEVIVNNLLRLENPNDANENKVASIGSGDMIFADHAFGRDTNLGANFMPFNFATNPQLTSLVRDSYIIDLKRKFFNSISSTTGAVRSATENAIINEGIEEHMQNSLDYVGSIFFAEILKMFSHPLLELWYGKNIEKLNINLFIDFKNNIALDNHNKISNELILNFQKRAQIDSLSVQGLSFDTEPLSSFYTDEEKNLLLELNYLNKENE